MFTPTIIREENKAMYILQSKSFKHSGLKNCNNQGTFVSLLTPISLMKAYFTIGSNLGVKLWKLADKLFDKHMVKDTGASEMFVNSCGTFYSGV